MESPKYVPRNCFKRPYVSNITITSDNKIIVSGYTKNTVRIWNFQDKFIVSGLADKTVRAWNLKYKCQEAVFEGHTDKVNRVARTSDNKFAVSCS